MLRARGVDQTDAETDEESDDPAEPELLMLVPSSVISPPLNLERLMRRGVCSLMTVTVFSFKAWRVCAYRVSNLRTCSDESKCDQFEVIYDLYDDPSVRRSTFGNPESRVRLASPRRIAPLSRVYGILSMLVHTIWRGPSNPKLDSS